MATNTAAARTAQDAAFAALWQKAKTAGLAAAETARPTPMIVGTPTTPLGSDIDYSRRTYYVAGGVCGFAWVWFAGNTAWGRWAKKAGIARSAYGGGMQVSAGNVGGQSMEIKEAWAHAVSEVLREAGVKAFADSRMD